MPVEQGPIVCFDTMMLLWGVKRQATAGEESMIDKTRRMMEEVEAAKGRIMVPCVALSELLVQCNDKERSDLMAYCKERFLLRPFDPAAAHCAAGLFKRHLDNQRHGVATTAAESSKKKVCADCMILATAIVSGAEKVYSADPHIATLAALHADGGGGRIEVVNPRTWVREEQGCLPTGEPPTPTPPPL